VRNKCVTFGSSAMIMTGRLYRMEGIIMSKKQKHKKTSGKTAHTMKNVHLSVSGESKNVGTVFSLGSSAEHYQEECFINENWQEYHLADIVIIRPVGSGFMVAGFLIDLWGVGLENAFLYNRVSLGTLDRIMAQIQKAATWVECSLPLAQELVYGGLAWARKHGFSIPHDAMRCLEILPPPAKEPSLSRFGEKDGRSVIIGGLRKMLRLFGRR